MQKPKDTTLLEDNFEDDFVNTTVPTSTNENGPYNLNGTIF
jgi:hypothetical protein